MKRLIISAALCVFIAALTFTGYAVIKSNCDEILKAVEECESLYKENPAAAAKKAKAAAKDWKRRETPLTLFSNHELIDSTAEEMCALPVYAENGSDEFYVCAQKIKRTVKQIAEEQRPGIQSFY